MMRFCNSQMLIGATLGAGDIALIRTRLLRMAQSTEYLAILKRWLAPDGVRYDMVELVAANLQFAGAASRIGKLPFALTIGACEGSALHRSGEFPPRHYAITA